MQGDDFVSDNVLARCERGRDGESVDTVRGGQEVRGGPEAGRGLSSLRNFEPHSARAHCMRPKVENITNELAYSVPGLHCVMSDGAFAM